AQVQAKLQRRVERSLRRLGIHLRLKERLLLTEAQRMAGWIESSRSYMTNHGDYVETDLLFVCTGNVRYNTRLVEDLAARTIEEVISRTGEIHVLPTLQLVAYPHIFAIGDCADASPIKLATAAFDQARFCARNIFRLIRHRRAWEEEQAAHATFAALTQFSPHDMGSLHPHQHCSGLATPSSHSASSTQDDESRLATKRENNPDESAKLALYRPVPKFVLSLGPRDGVGQWPYVGILPAWFACRHKSRRLMLGQIYRFFGAELPPNAKTI
ncbi:hypothetical protein THASP1DRAFT_26568, partial [Thamnocephalis sphaerospora]